MNYKKVFKRETKVIAYIVICLTLVVIGTSYALFLKVDSNSNNQVVNAGSLEITYSQGSTITVDENAETNCLTPQSDTDGAGSGGCNFTFSISNKGTLPSDYNLIIYNDPSAPSGTQLVDFSNIKYSLTKNYTKTPANNTTIGSGNAIGSLNNYGTGKKLLEKSTIAVGETITFSLKIWIKEDADESIIGQGVYLKLDAEGTVQEGTAQTK